MNDWDYYPELEKIPPGMPEPPVTPQGNAGADAAAQTTLMAELTEWFDELDFDRSNISTRLAEFGELQRIVTSHASPSVPSAQCNCHPYIADTYGHDKSCPMSSHHRTTEGEQS